jgi:hypothetical protein
VTLHFIKEYFIPTQKKVQDPSTEVDNRVTNPKGQEDAYVSRQRYQLVLSGGNGEPNVRCPFRTSQLTRWHVLTQSLQQRTGLADDDDDDDRSFLLSLVKFVPTEYKLHAKMGTISIFKKYKYMGSAAHSDTSAPTYPTSDTNVVSYHPAPSICAVASYQSPVSTMQTRHPQFGPHNSANSKPPLQTRQTISPCPPAVS